MDLQKQNCVFPQTEESKKQDYICKECGKAFQHKCQLNGHRSVHSEVNYPCLQCGRKFKHSTSLDIHMAMHRDSQRRANLEKYKCKKCKKQFSFPNNFRDHMLTHVCCRRYECLDCHISFSQTRALVKHMCIKHQGEVLQKGEFECINCLNWIMLRWTPKFNFDGKRSLCCRCSMPSIKSKYWYNPANNKSITLLNNQIQNRTSVPINTSVIVDGNMKNNYDLGIVIHTQADKVPLHTRGKLPMPRKGTSVTQVLSEESNVLFSKGSTTTMPSGTEASLAYAGNDIVMPAMRTVITLPDAGDNIATICRGTGFLNSTQSDLEMVPSKEHTVLIKEETFSENLKLEVKTETIIEEITIVKEEVEEDFNIEHVFIQE